MAGFLVGLDGGVEVDLVNRCGFKVAADVEVPVVRFDLVVGYEAYLDAAVTVRVFA